jgi:hypothetical protein
MPNWSPNWNDVRWDHAAANAAIAALNQAATALETGNIDRVKNANTAVKEWAGPHRKTFDEYIQRVLKEGGDLATAYRRAATDIANASRLATEEQNRRIRERQRWEDESQQERDDKRRDEERRRGGGAQRAI